MSTIPDLITLLSLDARRSSSAFCDRHRTIMITKDFCNTGDFVFNNLLYHFARKEPTTPILLICMHQYWTHYAASAAKCGFNLRRTQNMGNIETLDVMAKYLDSIHKNEPDFSPIDYILESVSEFVNKHSIESQGIDPKARVIKPVNIMIDDLSILFSAFDDGHKIYRLFSLIDKSLRNRSHDILNGRLSHFVVQTMTETIKTPSDDHLDFEFTLASLQNLSDISIFVRPLETGYSTRVDGTIKIIDNRLTSGPNTEQSSKLPSMLMIDNSGDIGSKKAFFYKVGDRRVRLTSNALLV